MNMVTGNFWDKNKMQEGLMPKTKPVPNAVREMRQAKDAVEDAIAELLDLLPENDLRFGMIRVLAPWLRSEIAAIPDDLLCEEKFATENG